MATRYDRMVPVNICDGLRPVCRYSEAHHLLYGPSSLYGNAALWPDGIGGTPRPVRNRSGSHTARPAGWSWQEKEYLRRKGLCPRTRSTRVSAAESAKGRSHPATAGSSPDGNCRGCIWKDSPCRDLVVARAGLPQCACIPATSPPWSSSHTGGNTGWGQTNRCDHHAHG